MTPPYKNHQNRPGTNLKLVNNVLPATSNFDHNVTCSSSYSSLPASVYQWHANSGVVFVQSPSRVQIDTIICPY